MIRSTHARRGSLTVEAALFLPVLAVLLLGGMEYGWMLLKLRQMDAVVEQAARVGASSHGTTAMVRTAADRLLEDAGLSGTDYRLDLTPADVAPGRLEQGQELCVTLSIPYGELSLTGLARPAPSLLPAPSHLVVTARGVKHGPL